MVVASISRRSWQRHVAGLELRAERERLRVELGVDELELIGRARRRSPASASSSVDARRPRPRRCRRSPGPIRARAPRRRARAPRAAAREPLTTSTPPAWAPPVISRWPIPASFVRAAGVDAPGAGAVLARDLADPRVDPEPAQRRGDDLRQALEALVRAGDGALGGRRPGERERALVEGRGAAAGEPDHGLEPRVARRGAPRARSPGAARSCFEKASSRAGRWRRKVAAELARGDPFEHRLGDPGAERGAVGKALPDQAQAWFWRIVSVSLQDVTTRHTQTSRSAVNLPRPRIRTPEAA